MNVVLSPRQIIRGLAATVGFLFIVNIGIAVLRDFAGRPTLLGLAPLFDFNREQNIPTLFSSVLFLLCAGLLFLIALKFKHQSGSFIAWLGLSVIFLFLAVDETALIHERLTDPVRDVLNTESYDHYGWVFAYALVILVLAALYFRFFLRLPKRTRYLFVIAGGIYIGGVIGFEVLSGHHHSLHGRDNFTYSLYSILEELCELTGLVVFIGALLGCLADESGHFTLRIVRG